MWNTLPELREILAHHQRLYYQGVPEISDEEYDALKRKLEVLERGPAEAVIDEDAYQDPPRSFQHPDAYDHDDEFPIY